MPTAEFVMEHGLLIQTLDTDDIAFDVFQLGDLWFRVEHNENGASEITLRGEM